jgi:hypothetical protein
VILQLLELEEEWTLILDDALANSFIAPATDDFEADSQLTSKFLILIWIVLPRYLEAGIRLTFFSILQVKNTQEVGNRTKNLGSMIWTHHLQIWHTNMQVLKL